MRARATTTAVVALAVVGAALLAALPAAASAPQAVSIVMRGALTGADSAAGTDSISGDFEDSGTYVETFRFAGTSIHGVKTLTGRNGTITLVAEAVVRWESPTRAVLFAGHWRFESGTGAYATIQGGGVPGVLGSADLAAGIVHVRHEGSVSLGRGEE
jgi:hypothetical protein